MTEECGHPTDGGDGPPCQNPATEGDSCWIESHGGHVSGHGPRTKLEKMDEVERSQTISDIAHVIEQGGSISEAARKTGVHRETVSRWAEMGENEDAGPHRELRDRLVRARGQGEATYRQALLQIAIECEDTATLMAMLKQRYSESWGDVDRGEQSGAQVNIHTEAPDDIEELIDQLRN